MCFKFIMKKNQEYRFFDRCRNIILIISTSKLNKSYAIYTEEYFSESRKCNPQFITCYFPCSPTPAKTATALIKWCRVILQIASKNFTDVEINSLAAILSLLASRIFATESKKVVEKAYRELSRIWKEFPLVAEKSLERVASVEKYQVSNAHMFLFLC